MRVLVTRPQPGAAETAARLTAAGFEPVVLPLTEVSQLPVRDADLPGQPDAIVATSANALRCLPPVAAARYAHIPLHAVGAATAAAARAAGFTQVAEGGGDAVALASAMANSLPVGSQILYLCGRVRLPDFERRLAADRMSVVAVETYDTMPTTPRPEAIALALGTRPIDAILLHSAASAKALGGVLQTLRFRLSPHVRIICLSDRISGALDRNLPGEVRVASKPTEEALLFQLSGQSA